MSKDVASVIDESPVGLFQWWVILLCGLVALLDGFDIQAMALVAPRLSEEWGVPRAAFGPILSASFLGIMFGAMLGGVLGDRFGRRWVLISSFLFVGAMSLAAAFAADQSQLFACRVATGAGIGACMPNFTALTAEYVPSKRVAFFVTLMYSAVPFGGVLGGFVAGDLIAQYGWRAVFVAGGVLPIAIALLLVVGLPESIRFLVRKGGQEAKIGSILGRIAKGYAYTQGDTFVAPAKPAGGSLRQLFIEGRAPLTIALWLVFFFGLFGMYMLTSWLPSVFTGQGWPMNMAILSASIFQLGGIFGGLIIGVLIDRLGPFSVLTGAFLLAAIFTAAIGSYAGTMEQVMVVIGFAGAAVVGAQLGATALAASIYPTTARSTGVGWALGLGRLGAVISPTVGGLAIAAGWTQPALFLGAAAPPAVCALVTLALWMTRRAPKAAVVAAA